MFYDVIEYEVFEELRFNIEENEQRFKLISASLPSGDGEDVLVDRWYIMDNGIPLFKVNEWLDELALNSINTARTYGSNLVRFLNYLHRRGKEYEEATNSDVTRYVKSIIYGELESQQVIEFKSKVRYKTVINSISAITTFYIWLDSEVDEEDEKLRMYRLKKSKNKARKSYFYGQIYESNYTELIERFLDNMQESREYIKWYSDEQIECLLSNFYTLRDRAIFLCTLEGMRIDEALSIKLIDYDGTNRTAQLSRSKSKEQKEAIIALSQKTCAAIDDYIFTERADAEIESGKLCEYLFINIKKGKHQGKPIGYRNTYGIIKACAKRAGLPIEKIRTHSGRSTHVMEYLEHQTLYPEDNITDEIIRQRFRWKQIDTIEFYKNHKNLVLAKSAADKIHKAKRDKK